MERGRIRSERERERGGRREGKRTNKWVICHKPPALPFLDFQEKKHVSSKLAHTWFLCLGSTQWPQGLFLISQCQCFSSSAVCNSSKSAIADTNWHYLSWALQVLLHVLTSSSREFARFRNSSDPVTDNWGLNSMLSITSSLSNTRGTATVHYIWHHCLLYQGPLHIVLVKHVWDWVQEWQD